MEIRGREIREIITPQEISSKVSELAEKIENELRSDSIVVIGLLKGAFVFTADLIRAMKKPVKVDFMWVSSYGSEMEPSQKLRFLKDIELNVEGEEVLLVDDILDTGLTIERVYEHLLKKNPRTLKTCVLIEKEGRRRTDFRADFVGFVVPNYFLVGYGLDWAEEGRNLPGIYAVEER